MNTYRILLSVHYKNGEWYGTKQVRSFYVHGVSADDARLHAIDIVMAAELASKDETDKHTSGNAIRVDSELHPVGFPEDYVSWSQ